jgi:large subunit ribosomal protein L22
MELEVSYRYAKVAPRKARLVVDLIRGRNAGQAINILRATNKRIAPAVEKVLRSAIANAENRSADVDVDKLVVSEAYVNEGPRMKRVRPAPMGRAYRYQRRLTHIVLSVAERESEKGLVTKVEETAPAAEPAKTGNAKKAAPKAAKTKAAAQAKETKPAAKKAAATKKKSGK